jgi:hypothetical protein
MQDIVDIMMAFVVYYRYYRKGTITQISNHLLMDV